tara:strand:- start:334 stop:525 length:192 start_codon:yes stop_codon:yes gene_type:complete
MAGMAAAAEGVLADMGLFLSPRFQIASFCQSLLFNPAHRAVPSISCSIFTFYALYVKRIIETA